MDRSVPTPTYLRISFGESLSMTKKSKKQKANSLYSPKTEISEIFLYSPENSLNNQR